MAATQSGKSPGSRPRDAQLQALGPYAALGQLSYAPATQTTVVTTTTTTTTSFPPLILKAPRHLHERDPKIYPLASSPTPRSIKRFCFDIGGRPTWFQEADEPDQALEEYQKYYAQLKEAKGTLHSVKTAELQYATPTRASRAHSQQQRMGRFPSPAPVLKKRSASPPSLAEAAEIASLHRRTGKQRATISAKLGKEYQSPGPSRPGLRAAGSFESVIPATPDTDTGNTGNFKIPKAIAGSKTKRMTADSDPGAFGERSHTAYEKETDGRGSSISEQQPPSMTALGRDWESTAPRPGIRVAAGISATPPVAETDLEPVTVCGSTNGDAPEVRRPTPLDTVIAQDVSLPSPSMSPIAEVADPIPHTSSFEVENADDESNDFSSLDISQGPFGESLHGESPTSHDGRGFNVPFSLGGDGPNSELPTPTVKDIPVMLDAFDAMPDELKTYVMYQMLRRCAKPTLRFVADVVNPALKVDFLEALPLELSLNILRHLDAKSMCRAAQVSKKWRHIVNSDEKAWKDLLDADEFDVPDGEIERAVREGWGWQFSSSAEGWERDLNGISNIKSEGEVSPVSASSPYGLPEADSPIPTSSSGRPKRKAAAKFVASNKRQKRKCTSAAKIQSPAWLKSFEEAAGPNACANTAVLAVPDPGIGLPTLGGLHLFKTIYQRHHLIRKAWMQEDIKPQHIAFRAHQRHVVTCLQFDQDKILTGSDDTNINVYDTKTGALRTQLSGHDGGVWALQYEGNTLVSGSTDRSVRVWDIEKGRCTHVFQGHTSTVRCLVILKPTQVGETADGEPIMMPRESLIITGSRDASLRIWRLPKPTEKGHFQAGPAVSDDSNPYFIRALTGHHGSVRAIAAHADTLVSGSYDCNVRVWKVSTGELVHRLQGHSQKVYSVVLDHQRNRCISGSMDNLVVIWNLETGHMIHRLTGHESLVGLLDLSHGKLVSAAADSKLRIWDPDSGNCEYELKGHSGAITCFQHDDQKVISGSDRTLKMWNIRTGECVKDLLKDLSGVWQVRFDARRCVAAVQRSDLTYIEVLDFGASRDGVPPEQRGRRILVNEQGKEILDADTEAVEAEGERA